MNRLRMIEAVLASFQRVEGWADCPLIIVCDGALTVRFQITGEKLLVGFLPLFFWGGVSVLFEENLRHSKHFSPSSLKKIIHEDGVKFSPQSSTHAQRHLRFFWSKSFCWESYC